MKLRLYHHPDGARVAYREAGTGPGLAILHSATLSHREWAPIVEDLAVRYRVVLPDLPLHGDSEDRPRHPYTLEWMCEVMAGFVRDTCGPRPLVAGHELGAEHWAAIASLVETCKLGRINPNAYLADVLARIVLRGDGDPLDDLLPGNWDDTNAAAPAFETNGLSPNFLPVISRAGGPVGAHYWA